VRAAPTLALALLSACASAPPPAPPTPRPPAGVAIARAAAALVGSPYHFGGADLSGFDCSGLALYVHERVGLSIPRTAAEQQRGARPVPLAQLSPGDLLFFSIGARGIDHVGVYTGDERFVHARRAGIKVTYGNLHAGSFYARHLVSAGRFWDRASASPP